MNREPGMNRALAATGAALGALAVVVGAFGAHGLENVITADMLAIWETGVKYHFYHTLAILFAAHSARSRWCARAGWAFVVGIAIFSGSLYALALSGITILGAITPIGGLAFIAGWIMLAMGYLKSPIE